MMRPIIEAINVGIVENKAGWAFTYSDGRKEAFALDLEIARQFWMSLQEMILQLEHQQQSQVFTDHTGVGESAQLRISPPAEEIDNDG